MKALLLLATVLLLNMVSCSEDLVGTVFTPDTSDSLKLIDTADSIVDSADTIPIDTLDKDSVDSIAATQEDLFRNEMVLEINMARTEPQRYAEERLKSYYTKGTDNGAYTELLNFTAVPALSLQDQLTSAADKYAQFLAENNLFSHTADGTPSERCKREGYDYYSGENIAAGSYSVYSVASDPKTAAREFILMWIIDSGIEGVGHRKNILKEGNIRIGIGYHYDGNSTYKNYAVQDFGWK